MIRENSRAAPVIVTTNANSSSGSSIFGSGPLIQGADLLAGPMTVRDGRIGFGAKAGLRFSKVFGDRLTPYLAVELGSARVKGSLGDGSYSGSVTSRGVGAGVSLGLPRIRAVMPAVSVGVVSLNGGVSGDTPTEDELVNSVYGGLMMGTRVSLDGTWQRRAGSPWLFSGSLARTWAGARGGWAAQVGLRWVRPLRPGQPSNQPQN